MKTLISWVFYPLEYLIGLIIGIFVELKRANVFDGSNSSVGNGISDAMKTTNSYSEAFKTAVNQDKEPTTANANFSNAAK